MTYHPLFQRLILIEELRPSFCNESNIFPRDFARQWDVCLSGSGWYDTTRFCLNNEYLNSKLKRRLKNRLRYFYRYTLFENYSKCRILILAFSTNFCPIKNDLSGNTVWPQTSDFQKLAKICHFWPV